MLLPLLLILFNVLLPPDVDAKPLPLPPLLLLPPDPPAPPPPPTVPCPDTPLEGLPIWGMCGKREYKLF